MIIEVQWTGRKVGIWHLLKFLLSACMICGQLDNLYHPGIHFIVSEISQVWIEQQWTWEKLEFDTSSNFSSWAQISLPRSWVHRHVWSACIWTILSSRNKSNCFRNCLFDTSVKWTAMVTRKLGIWHKLNFSLFELRFLSQGLKCTGTCDLHAFGQLYHQISSRSPRNEFSVSQIPYWLEIQV